MARWREIEINGAQIQALTIRKANGDIPDDAIIEITAPQSDAFRLASLAGFYAVRNYGRDPHGRVMIRASYDVSLLGKPTLVSKVIIPPEDTDDKV